jgi:hypothetical protein
MISLHRLLPWLLASLYFSLGAAADPSPAPAKVDKRHDVVTYFYKDPRPERLAGFMQTYADGPAGQNWIAYPPIAGFLAVVFRRHPDVVTSVLPERPNPQTADAFRAAIQLSGNNALAKELQARLSKAGSDPILTVEFAHLPTRLEDLRIRTPTHLDILWGAAFASGDAQFVRMILDYLASVTNESEAIYRDVMWAAIRLSDEAAKLKFWQELRARYGDAGSRRIIAAAVALWALKVNAQQHAFVHQAISAYSANHAGTNGERALRVYGKAMRLN